MPAASSGLPCGCSLDEGRPGGTASCPASPARPPRGSLPARVGCLPQTNPGPRGAPQPWLLPGVQAHPAPCFGAIGSGCACCVLTHSSCTHCTMHPAPCTLISTTPCPHCPTRPKSFPAPFGEPPAGRGVPPALRGHPQPPPCAPPRVSGGLQCQPRGHGGGGRNVPVTQAPHGTASLRAHHRHGNHQAISGNCAARRPGNGAK